AADLTGAIARGHGPTPGRTRACALAHRPDHPGGRVAAKPDPPGLKPGRQCARTGGQVAPADGGASETHATTCARRTGTRTALHEATRGAEPGRGRFLAHRPRGVGGGREPEPRLGQRVVRPP